MLRNLRLTVPSKAQIASFYSDDQIKSLIVLQKVRMTWIMFWFSMFVFIVILCALFYSILFNTGDVWTRISLALLNGIVGSSIRRIVFYLFPASLRQ
jgi:hypothetical protein